MHQECLRHIQSTVPNWQDVFHEVEEMETDRPVQQRQKDTLVPKREPRTRESRERALKAWEASEQRIWEENLAEMIRREEVLQELQLQRNRRNAIDLPESARSEYTCTDESETSIDFKGLKLFPEMIESFARDGSYRLGTADYPQPPKRVWHRHSSSGQSSSSLRSTLTRRSTGPPPQHRKF